MTIAPGQTPGPQGNNGAGGGLTSGETVLIVFVVIFLTVLAAAVGYTFLKRSKARRSYQNLSAEAFHESTSLTGGVRQM
jgi:hypothetical protein